jgi:lycopene cyclase domain-containing protein
VKLKKFSYLLTLFSVFCIPTIVAGFYLSAYIDLQALVPFIVLVTIIGSIWDVWATRHGKKDRVWLWQFNRKQTIGLRLLGLPIEEYVFYVASSVYVIFMWEGFKLMVKGSPSEVYYVIAILSAWTLFSIFLPYIVGWKRDKFVG